MTVAQWQAATGVGAGAAALTLVNRSGGDFHLMNDGYVALTQGRAAHGVGGPVGTTIRAAYIAGSESIGPAP